MTEPTESDLRSAEAPQQTQGAGDVSAHKVHEKTTWHRVRDWPAQKWPAHREARGDFTLNDSPDSTRALRAVCTIQHGVLCFSIVNPPGIHSGKHTSISVEIPVQHLAVGLQRGRNTMPSIAKLHKDVISDEIYCFAQDQATRNKWTGIFRRMGVPIFNLNEREKRHAEEASPLGPDVGLSFAQSTVIDH